VILAVVRTGWMNLRRDRAATMLSFVVPIVFFSIFASIFGAQRSSTPKVTVALVDEDQSPHSKELVVALHRETALNVVETPKNETKKFDAASATAYVRSGKAPAALVIPKGFGAAPIAFGPSTNRGPAFRLLSDPSDPIAKQVVFGLLQKTLMTAMPDAMITSGMEALDRWGGGLTPQQRAMMAQQTTRLQQMPSSQRQQAGGGSGSIVNLVFADVIGDTNEHPIVAFYAAGIGVMFMLFTASNAGGALLEEVESGTLDRILSTRVSMNTLLLGKLLYLWTLGALQLVVMFVWGALVFHLPLVRHLAGFAIMTAATALACSAFGLLLASAARTRSQLGAISTLAVLSISALGGSMFPRFLMPEALQKAGLVLFNAWAIEGFTNVFWRDEPLTSIALPVAVLAAWGVGFFLGARHLTRRWETI
jgi:ABC-2 type transport system permease protein